MYIKKQLVAITILLLSSILSFAQNCGESCTWTVTTADATDYTVNSTQTLCITEDGVAKGHITLSGGTICNDGVINTSLFTCTLGSLNNYGTLMYTGNLSLSADNLMLNNKLGATLNVLGTLTLSNSGSTLTNQGTVNCSGNIILSAGTIINSGTMNYSDITKTGGTNTNSGTVNCCGN